MNKIYLTDDNPRQESPNKIREDIKKQIRLLFILDMVDIGSFLVLEISFCAKKIKMELSNRKRSKPILNLHSNRKYF